ncbi:MAG TPA: tetratricopeptide repeat protein [Myxococcales bacterium]|nr:tetratricopeptide repeat protein [Myxococcales bacterium]
MPENQASPQPAAAPEKTITVPPELAERLVKGEITLGEFFGLSPNVLYGIAKIAYQLLNTGRVDAALDIYKGLVAASPYDSVFHCHLAACYYTRENYDLAMKHFERSLEINLSNVDALVGRGELYLRKGKIPEALMDWKQAIDLDPDAKRASTKRARSNILMLKEMADQERARVLAKVDPARFAAEKAAKEKAEKEKAAKAAAAKPAPGKAAAAPAKAKGPPQRRGSSTFEVSKAAKGDKSSGFEAPPKKKK